MNDTSGASPRAALPTRYGDFAMIVFASDVDSEQHIALVRGDLTGAPPLVRVHRTASPAMYSGPPIATATTSSNTTLEAIVAENRGVFVYLHHTGRGFGIDSTAPAPARCRIFCITRAASSTGTRPATPPAARKRIGAQILIDLGLKNLRVLTITRGRLSPSKAMA